MINLDQKGHCIVMKQTISSLDIMRLVKKRTTHICPPLNMNHHQEAGKDACVECKHIDLPGAGKAESTLHLLTFIPALIP